MPFYNVYHSFSDSIKIYALQPNPIVNTLQNFCYENIPEKTKDILLKVSTDGNYLVLARATFIEEQPKALKRTDFPKEKFEHDFTAKYENFEGTEYEMPTEENTGATIIRPRSLYTAHSYHTSPEDHYEVYDEYGQYDTIPDSWHLGRGEIARYRMPGLRGRPSYRSLSGRTRMPKIVPSLMNQDPAIIGEGLQPTEPWQDNLDVNYEGPIVTQIGTISLRLRDKLKVEMTLDRSVRVINFQNSIVLSLNPNGTSSALIHPNGRIYQYGSRVEIQANDPDGNHKFAKMWYKGVSFSSANCAVIYLVDQAGTRTTTDQFANLNYDFTQDIYLGEARTGQDCIRDCFSALENYQYYLANDGAEVWIINGIRVAQARDGQVRVMRDNGKRLLRTSPTLGTASITTPFIHATASMGHNPHLFVRRGERRLHYDAHSFVARNAGHSAGFDENGRLKVY